MKRPAPASFWILSLFILCLGGYLFLTAVIPQGVLSLISSVLKGSVTVESAQLLFPFTLQLSGVRFYTPAKETAISIRRLVLRPQGLSWRDRTFWFDAIEIEAPVWRLVRSSRGEWFLPTAIRPLDTELDITRVSRVPDVVRRVMTWGIGIKRLSIMDGMIELVDHYCPSTFHGLLDHVAIEVGELRLPPGGFKSSFAVHGELIGHSGEMAPLYCSGWVDMPSRDIDTSCRLEPFALAAFEPYYGGQVQLRVYGTTVESTVRLAARSNVLEGQIRFVLGNLTEGDLSVRGKTILDVKRLSRIQEGPLRVNWQLAINGALDDPTSWDIHILPGSPSAQQITDRWIEHGVRQIAISVLGHVLAVQITPTDSQEMTDIEVVSKRVIEALEILALPVPGSVPEQEQLPLSSDKAQESGIPTDTPSVDLFNLQPGSLPSRTAPLPESFHEQEPSHVHPSGTTPDP